MRGGDRTPSKVDLSTHVSVRFVHVCARATGMCVFLRAYLARSQNSKELVPLCVDLKTLLCKHTQDPKGDGSFEITFS